MTPSGAVPNNPALAPRLTLRIPHQRVMHTDYVRVFARCSERCTVRFAGRAKTAPRRGEGPDAQARGVFRGERRARTVRVRREHAMRLRLTPAGRAVLRRTLDRRGRVGVVITATVRGVARHADGAQADRAAHDADPEREADLVPLTCQRTGT